MRSFTKKILSGMLIALFLFSNLSLARADWFGISDIAGNSFDSVLSNYGVNTQELKNTVGDVNNMRQKKMPPQVTLSFTPTSPVPGQKITALATPGYFMNDSDQLYYTWYIKHANGKNQDVSGLKTEDGNTDWNGDGKINIEDYKIEAMRTLVNGGFDWQNADYSKSSNDAGYKSILGGNDKQGMSDHCYVHDFTSGDEYEITCQHLFPDEKISGEKIGDGKFSREEEKFWHTDPNSNDTANNGNVDEATITGLNQTTFSWTFQSGDQVGVAVEGISVEPTAYADSSYKIMWAMPKNKCDVSLGDVPQDTTSAPSAVTTYEMPSGNKIITTTTIKKSYVKGDYTVTSGQAPKVLLITTTTTTIVTKKYEKTGDDIHGNPIFSPTPYYDNTNSPDISITSDKDAPTNSLPVKTTINDVNACLESNLVSPAEGNTDKKLAVSLSYSPDSPNNDLSISNANSDQLIIQADVDSAENSHLLNYAWQLSLGNGIAAQDWYPLTKDEITKQTGLMQTNAVGLNSIKLNLDFSADFLKNIPQFDQKNQTIFYLKAHLIASENTSNGLKRAGNDTIIIPINISSLRIQAFPTLVSNTLDISLNEQQERCSAGTSQFICPIAKNEIIGVKVDLDPNKYNLLWTLNDTALPYQGICTNKICDADKNFSIVNYFPVLKEQGTQYTLNLVATNRETSEKISLTKVFKVSDPSLGVVSADEKTCAPVLLGNYVDLDGKQWPDYSLDSFEALQGETIKLKPFFNTPFANDYFWSIDGVTIDDSNAAAFGANIDSGDGSLSFPANKSLGDSYDVSISSLYTQSALAKKALQKYWNVSLADFYEKPIGTSINIQVTDTLTDAAGNITGSVKNTKVLASLFSQVPSYINFLFRVILTIALILFTTSILFSLSPKQSEN